MTKGDLSRFVEEAVRWRSLDQTVQGIKDRNRNLPAAELEASIDEALQEVRTETRGST